MRPLKLTFQAFGPFAQATTLDFRELGDSRFFLIHGPTGAGKTTILDAICFALYGVTSGPEREARLMRSHYADDAILTQVTLDFALGGEVYRITRSPEQTRRKKRGGGTTGIGPQATLWQRTGLDDEAAEGTVLSDRSAEVTREISCRLGFQSEQFRQVILLPQGRFRDLLLADSRQREVLFEILFDAEVYRRIEEELQKAAAEITLEAKTLGDRQRLILSQLRADSVEELSKRHQADQALLTDLKDRLAKRREEERTAQDRLQLGRTDSLKIEELAQAKVALTDRESQVPLFEQKGQVLESARRAALAQSAEVLLAGRRQELVEADRKRETAESHLERARQAQILSLSALSVEENREAERTEANKLVSYLEHLAPLVAELDALRLARQTAAVKAQKKSTEWLAMQKELAQVRTDLAAGERLLRESLSSAGRLESQRLEHQQLENIKKQRYQFDQVKKKLNQAKGRNQEAARRAGRTEQDYQLARRKLAEAETAWSLGQAALLAQGLEEGQPCPVCGSTSHPAPAIAAAEVPGEALLMGLRSAVEQREKEHAAAGRTEALRREESMTLEAQTLLIKESLGPWGDRDLAALESLISLKAKEMTAAEEAGRKVISLEQELNRLRERERQLGEKLKGVEAAHREAEQALTQATAILTDRQAQIPPELQTSETIDQARSKAQRKAGDLREKLANARKSAQEANERLAGAEAACLAAQEATVQARERLILQETAFGQALRAAGFADEAEYHAAKREQSELDRLSAEIKRFEADLSAARARAVRAEEAARGLVRPDIEALAAAADHAKTALETDLQEEARLTEQMSHLVGQLSALADLSQKLKIVEDEYGVVGRLAEVASGKNPKNLTLQRFVLAALLDDVLAAASVRLKIMTGNRYQLERAAEGRDRRSAWGLDLQVFDAYTGQARPVATLSGGESFLAALALALGLADVVQSYAGGIHLETIFVDEGFGSLDPEALDLALRALMDLRQGGRLVGLISHVPELKERLTTRLEVIPTRQGSTARFVNVAG